MRGENSLCRRTVRHRSSARAPRGRCEALRHRAFRGGGRQPSGHRAGAVRTLPRPAVVPLNECAASQRRQQASRERRTTNGGWVEVRSQHPSGGPPCAVRCRDAPRTAAQGLDVSTRTVPAGRRSVEVAGAPRRIGGLSSIELLGQGRCQAPAMADMADSDAVPRRAAARLAGRPGVHAPGTAPGRASPRAESRAFQFALSRALRR